MSTKLPCPSCGGEVTLHSFTPYVVCSYCRHILIKKGDNYEDSGEVSGIAQDMSPFQIGTEGWYQNVHFALIGRLRMAWDDGFWNEWYAYFDDGRFGWLAEAQGTLAVLFENTDTTDQESVQKLIDTSDSPLLLHGKKVVIIGVSMAVSDLKKADCIVVEGETPRLFMAGRRSASVDLMGSDGSIATIEFVGYPRPWRLFTGRYVSFSDLRFTGLRELEGWSLP